VLSASYGGGHQRVAEVLERAWKARVPGARVEIIDFFERFVNRVLNAATRSVYVNSVRHAPFLWGAFYYSTGNIRPDSAAQRAINRMGSRRLLRHLRAERPDVVVNVHPTPAGVLSDLKARGDTAVPSAVVVTDYVVHSQWIHPWVDRYCVATPTLAEGLAARGVAAERVRVTGIPIGPGFAKPLDRGETAARLGLDPNRKTVLVMAGAYAMLGGITEVHRVLMASGVPAQCIFICGRDEGLVETLRKSSGGRPDVHVRGYVDNVAEWMTVSDLLITKAGGITVSEALAKELPMIIYRPIPGQEDWNTKMLTAGGAAREARSSGALAETLALLLGEGDALSRMRAAAARLARPNAAADAADAVLEIAGLSAEPRA
jgi:processive 1,2-diacylglycerol beta-glucosyltransferase